MNLCRCGCIVLPDCRYVVPGCREHWPWRHALQNMPINRTDKD